ncbi:hypothetical protein EXIGLDRAFT_845081 [Exidia glandulosa HHB12029]|uniref:Uncharacterized protein n=1 Tax=Exidia glandulosa HHB12029 TaxID=1314781 RepID=A0A165ZAR6_EXIGL|nr:hypothetical protein EXIGLDRAFT_845081 [Exidia glandulosa HHB12029]
MLLDLFAVIVAAVLSVRGAPALTQDPQAAERPTAGVFVATDLNWGGDTLWIPDASNGSCIVLPAPFYQGTSSFGPDKGIACSLWYHDDCDSRNPSFGPLRTPGVSTPADWSNATYNPNSLDNNGIAPNSWDKQVTAFNCWKVGEAGLRVD